MDGVVDEDELEEGEIRGCGEVPDRVEAERGRQLKEVVDPRRPSTAEVEAHWRGNHGSYRNWCPICVKARGKDLDHRADAGEELDYRNMLSIMLFQEMNLAIRWLRWWVLNGKRAR